MNAVVEQVLGAVAKKWERDEELAEAQRQAEVEKFIAEQRVAEQDRQQLCAVTGIEAAGAELERANEQEDAGAETDSELGEEHGEHPDGNIVADGSNHEGGQQKNPVVEAAMRLLSRSVLQVCYHQRLSCVHSRLSCVTDAIAFILRP